MKNFLYLTLGIAIGSVGCYFFLKDKFDKRFEEEWRKEWEKEKSEPVEENETDNEEEEESQDYEDIIETESYRNAETENKRPYVITSEDFAYDDSMDKITLYYHSDKIVADSDGNAIEDVEDVIGFDSLNHIGEYANDCVYVRNERLRCDYEVLLSQIPYAEVLRKKPYLKEEL